MIDDLLEKDKRGNVLRTIRNFITILENDPALKGHIYKDILKGAICVRGGLPWNSNAYQWTNDDDVDLRIYVETRYRLRNQQMLSDVLIHVANMHKEHPIRNYLSSLNWDGKERLDRLISYLGADDNELTRIMTRKWVCSCSCPCDE